MFYAAPGPVCLGPSDAPLAWTVVGGWVCAGHRLCWVAGAVAATAGGSLERDVELSLRFAT